MKSNPFDDRLAELTDIARRRKLNAVMLFGQVNRRALTDVDCDNGCLILNLVKGKATFYTDFRYVPMVRRTAPWLDLETMWKSSNKRWMLRKIGGGWKRIGIEGSIAASQFLELEKIFSGATLIDIEDDVLELRAVKTVSEIAKIAAAEALNDRIWKLSKREFRKGMTEKDMQRVIRAYMNALGDGEAFETIVCVGANAAECHHVPDGTVWNGLEPILVDMGVKLDGVCSDMTRNIKPRAKWPLREKYDRIYDIVLKANKAAIEGLRPGMKCRDLDAIARNIIKDAGYDKMFGHSLGHGVGFEIHEMPYASSSNDMVLEEGMTVTIEPGIYIENELGIRIEDLVLVTADGAEVLSSSPKE